jgi:DNA-directed RNA polymerase subunit F
MRLFNEEAGQKYLEKMGVPNKVISNLPLLGISSLANLLMAIKFAKYYELTRKDTIMTVFTDSMTMYQSRLKEYEEKFGKYKEIDAAVDYHRSLQGIKTDSMIELRYTEKQRIHHLKYFTWVEQQGKSVEELNQQWHDEENYWNTIYNIAPKLDELITEFNKQVALL